MMSNWSKRRNAGVGGSDESGTNDPVRYVRQRMREAETIIKGQKEELNYYRAELSEVAKERNELLRLLSQKENLGDDRAQLTHDLKIARQERDSSVAELRMVRQELHELAQYCDKLERMLQREREQHAATQEVIVLLEAQVSELELMVEELREHKRFMTDGKG